MVSPALRRSGRLYVWAVIAVGFAVLAKSLGELATGEIGRQWFLLAALTLVSGSATVKLPSVPASISISETFVVAAVLLYGPAAGTVIVALDGLVISYWIAKRRREIYRALFNMSAPPGQPILFTPKTTGVLNVYACDLGPNGTSTLNLTPGRNSSTVALVRTSAGNVCAVTSTGAQVRLEVIAHLSTTGMGVRAQSAVRALDTRVYGSLTAGVTRTLSPVMLGSGPGSTAVTMTVTLLNPAAAGAVP